MADRRPAMLHLFRNYDAPYDSHYQLRDARFPRPPVPAGMETVKMIFNDRFLDILGKLISLV